MKIFASSGFGFLMLFILMIVSIALGYQLFTADKTFGGFCFCVLAAYSGTGCFCIWLGVLANR